ncbi:MAG TPA: hypothetical protein VFS42_11950 [Burkholderiaceae bacterium]|nr:hypothetical protein [Burkholderiaceae bacterium]
MLLYYLFGDRKLAKQTRRTSKPARGDDSEGFINVAVSKKTRDGLHLLKEAMGVRGQSEVVEKLVSMGVAIHESMRD